MKRLFIYLLTGQLSLALGQSVPENWLTYYESSGYNKTPRYDETIDFCRRLELASPWIKLRSFGKTAEGREMYMVIASKDKAFDPQKAHQKEKAILLVQNGIHAGEIDGKDACLMLLRDIAVTKTMESMLDHLILIVIPVYNIDGHERMSRYNRINQNGPEEMGWRVTGQNLNLNRDYMKADAPETQAWLKMFNEWMPDFFIDAHVTDGADYQHAVTYGLEKHQNLSPPVRRWVIDKYSPMIAGLKTNGVPVAPYVSLRDHEDPLKGLQSGVAPPRLSTPYAALHNRPALLIETHMMKDYRTRVEGTYQTIAATMRLLNAEYKSLKEAVLEADRSALSSAIIQVDLRFETSEMPNGTVRYLGFKQTTQPSEISGGKWTVYSKEPFEAEVPYYDSVRSTKTVDLPAAYLIPPQWQEVIRRLGMHGLMMKRLSKGVELDVEMYRFSNAKWQTAPYEGRHPVSYNIEKFTVKRSFPAGTAVIFTRQRAAKVAAFALEPESPDAFATWGFFDAVFEQKEYAENYVMEPIAREMLAKDEALKVEYEKILLSDSTFASSPFARLNYFYQRSPWWDQNVNLYPVGRLMTNTQLPLKD